MIAVSMNTRPSMKLVLILPSASGCLEIPSAALPPEIPIPMPPPHEASPIAIPAAIAFAAMNYLYLETQVMVTRLNGIYGAFAAVPLFMIWLNIGWFIILIGAELSYAFQHVESYNIEESK